MSGLLPGTVPVRDLNALIALGEQSWVEIGMGIEGPQNAAVNGRLPASALDAIPGGKLEKDAARAWNDMRAYIGKRHGVWIAPTGPNSSYRTYAGQVYFWRIFQAGTGNTAAYPGTSNHGWGNAVDVATTTMAYYIRKYGARFGWSWDEGQRVGEWWHFRYIGGYKPKPKNPYPFIKPGNARRDAVRRLQRRLRAHGRKSIKVDGVYGKQTQEAVKSFKKNNGLKHTAAVGDDAWRLLRMSKKKLKARKKRRTKK